MENRDNSRHMDADQLSKCQFERCFIGSSRISRTKLTVPEVEISTSFHCHHGKKSRSSEG